jgi:hypothetical protein
VCNLYSVYTTQEAMRRAFEVARDSAGNVPPARNLSGPDGPGGEDD